MRRIKVGISMRLQGCEIEEEIEVEDDATEEDIEEQVREWAFGNVEWWHEEIKAAESGAKG